MKEGSDLEEGTEQDVKWISKKVKIKFKKEETQYETMD